jgi:hypothetical protein
VAGAAQLKRTGLFHLLSPMRIQVNTALQQDQQNKRNG